MTRMAQIPALAVLLLTTRANSRLPVTFTVTTPGVYKLAADLVTPLSAGAVFHHGQSDAEWQLQCCDAGHSQLYCVSREGIGRADTIIS
jgi:hypothetical protein